MSSMLFAAVQTFCVTQPAHSRTSLILNWIIPLAVNGSLRGGGYPFIVVFTNGNPSIFLHCLRVFRPVECMAHAHASLSQFALAVRTSTEHRQKRGRGQSFFGWTKRGPKFCPSLVIILYLHKKLFIQNFRWFEANL